MKEYSSGNRHPNFVDYTKHRVANKCNEIKLTFGKAIQQKFEAEKL